MAVYLWIMDTPTEEGNMKLVTIKATCTETNTTAGWTKGMTRYHRVPETMAEAAIRHCSPGWTMEIVSR